MIRRLLAIAFAAVLALAAPSVADAAIYNVTTGADGSGECPIVKPGAQCTLRTALSNAATSSGDDTINLPARTYTVSAALGDLDMQGGVTIVGAGANATFVEGGGAVRVFHVTSSGNALQRLTVGGGAALADADGYGGNIETEHGSGLTLDHVRVTRGAALHGGGIATSGGATLAITQSLIDNNEARTSAANPSTTGDGGGILLRSTDNAQTVTMADSTVASNRAVRAAGLLITGTNGGNLGQLTRVTIADNVATTFAGGLYVAFGSATIQGSIIARNQGPSGAPNCLVAAATPPRLTDNGANVESGTDCNFTLASDRRNTTAGLATTLSDDGGTVPVLTIPINSAAHDLYAGRTCGGTDQRDVARPQDKGCDAGAYEALLTLPETTVAGGPPFTFTAEAGSTFECSLDGAAFAACSSPFTPTAGPGAHSLAVRATDYRGNLGNPTTVSFTVPPPVVQPQVTPTPTPTPTATPAPTPVVGKTVVVKEVAGTVRVKLPGTKTFIDLDVTRGIPVGSTVDAKKGTVELTSIPKAGAPPETARFYDGIFKVTQKGGITTLTLVEALAPCPKKSARAAASKPKKRRLWGDGKGSFRTQGKYSAATIRGTKWLVEDSCAGTLTRVAQGVVTVRDDVKRKTIVLRAPKKYLARPKK